MENLNKITFNTEKFYNLILSAEGGRQGWYFPIFASIVKGESGDTINLDLGDQFSGSVIFIDGENSFYAGSIETWECRFKEEDAEAWAEENSLTKENFDSDREMEYQANAYAENIIDDEYEYYNKLADKQTHIIDLSKYDEDFERNYGYIGKLATIAKKNGYSFFEIN